MKILILDTDVLTCEFLAGYLKVEGHEVITMTPHPSSFNQISILKPQILFLGGNIPVMESLGMVKATHRQHPDITIFMIGGEGNQGHEDEFALAGSKGFISRGETFENLIRKIRATMESIKSKDMGKVKIMIVDDDPNIRDILSLHLSESGFDVVEAENGRIAVEKAKMEQPRIILMDYMMPELNGLEALKQIMEHNIHATVVMQTAVSEEWVWKKSRELGAFDYLVKPIDLKHLDLLISTKLLLM